MARPQPPELEYDEFSASIPGESLTKEPGSASWETPPRYTQVEDVADILMKKIFEKENTKRIMMMLDAGIPVEGVAKTILFAGFSEGQFTPDVAILVGRLVFEAILTVGVIGKVENLRITLEPQNRENDDFEFEMGQLKFAKKIADNGVDVEEKEADKEDTENSGLMARPMEDEE